MEKKTNLIFGVRSIIEAVNAGENIDKVMISNNAGSELVRELKTVLIKNDVSFQYVPIEKINRISRKNHQGVIAFVSPIPFHDIELLLPIIFEQGKTPLFLILDNITDIRNFGAIARTAECAGVDGIIIPQKGAAQINADAIKVSAGALFNVPVIKTKSITSVIKLLMESGLQIVAATEKGNSNYYDVDLAGPTAIVMGSEESGVHSDIIKIADHLAKIPMFGKTDSLNVSVSTGIVLFEALRQRG